MERTAVWQCPPCNIVTVDGVSETLADPGMALNARAIEIRDLKELLAQNERDLTTLRTEVLRIPNLEKMIVDARNEIEQLYAKLHYEETKTDVENKTITADDIAARSHDNQNDNAERRNARTQRGGRRAAPSATVFPPPQSIADPGT